MSRCTMFTFEGVADPNLLHCTHKFFSDECSVANSQIIAQLEAYFGKKPFKSFKINFDKIEHLGIDKSYRVATTDKRDEFLLDLKAELDRLHPDDFESYIPHVTVGRNTDAIHTPFSDYVLMDNYNVVWSASQYQAKMIEDLVENFKDRGGVSMDQFNVGLRKSAGL